MQNNNIHGMTGGVGSADGGTIAAKRGRDRRALFDVLIFIVLLIPVIIFEAAVQPTRRGFFCDDNTIRLPFHTDTVTPAMLGVMIMPLPVVFIFFVEYLRHRRCDRLTGTVSLWCWQMPQWLSEALAISGHFMISAIATFDITEVAKYTIGRLRPHFIAVCQPRLFDGSTCADLINQNRYIEDYVCVAEGYTALDVRQARLSFPSGHSSFSFHAMVFLTLYLHKKLSWRGAALARPLLQLVCISVAWFTALSRVMDNWHHWEDVLVGSLIGTVVCVLYMVHVQRFFKTSHETQYKIVALTHQNTTASLADVCSRVPPPYGAAAQQEPKDFVTIS